MDIRKDMQKIKKLLNISPQETAIAKNLTVKENLLFIAGVYEIEDKHKKVDELIKQFRLGEVLNQRAGTLSGGWQRKLSLAMALVNDPKILFLDEPTLGLDVISRKELWDIIKSKKGNMTIILTTHYMEEAEKLSDRIGIMSNGVLKRVGTASQLKAMEKVETFEEAFIKIATDEVLYENN